MFLVPSSPTNVNCDSGRRECVVAVEPHVGDLLILNFACEEDEEVDDDSNDHEDFNVVLVVPVGPVMGGDVCDFVCGIVFIVDEMTKLSPVILDSHLGFFFVINFRFKLSSSSSSLSLSTLVLSSASNGCVERGVQLFEELLRKWKLATEV